MKDFLNSFDNEVIGEIFNVVKRQYTTRLPHNVLDQLELSRQVDYVSGEMLYRLEAYLASNEEIIEEPVYASKEYIEPIETNREHDYVEIPATWWDMFKRDVLKVYLPARFAEKFEVYTTRIVTVTVHNITNRKLLTQRVIKKTVIRPDVEIPGRMGASDHFVRRHYKPVSLQAYNGEFNE